MDFLYQYILAPVVPFLPFLLVIVGAVVLWWLIKVIINPR